MLPNRYRHARRRAPKVVASTNVDVNEVDAAMGDTCVPCKDYVDKICPECEECPEPKECPPCPERKECPACPPCAECPECPECPPPGMGTIGYVLMGVNLFFLLLVLVAVLFLVYRVYRKTGTTF